MIWPWSRDVVSREEHERRVSELLLANAEEVARRRKAEEDLNTERIVVVGLRGEIRELIRMCGKRPTIVHSQEEHFNGRS
jgi:uncharacterized Rossmann fold enzyme